MRPLRRRDFTAGLLLAAIGRSARAQAPAAKRIAIIAPNVPVAEITEKSGYFWWRAFFAELRRLGDVEGQNLIIDGYSAEGHPGRYAELVGQAVKSRPDLILAPGTPIARAAKAATHTIPIVALMEKPEEQGLVASVARPGGNLTGLSFDVGLEVYGKLLQMLKEVVPSAGRITVLATPETWNGPVVPYMHGVGLKMGISLKEKVLPEESRSALKEGFDAILRDRPDAVYFMWDTIFVLQRNLVLDFLATHRLPASFFWKEIVEAGGLLSYGDDTSDLFRRWAGIVHRVLAGTKPGDIPIERPTKYVFAVNLRTARALGLTIPQSLLAFADEVIQ